MLKVLISLDLLHQWFWNKRDISRVIRGKCCIISRMFDAADRKKFILKIALLLPLNKKNRYYFPPIWIFRLNQKRNRAHNRKRKTPMNDVEKNGTWDRRRLRECGFKNWRLLSNCRRKNETTKIDADTKVNGYGRGHGHRWRRRVGKTEKDGRD